jgi:hypothetical protein
MWRLFAGYIAKYSGCYANLINLEYLQEFVIGLGKFPVELDGIRNIVNNQLAVERLKRILDSAGVLRPYLLSVALGIIDSMKLSVSENLSVNERLSFYYTGIQENESNKLSKEEYTKFLTAFSASLNSLNEEQTKTFAEYLVSLMMNSHLIMGIVLLYALSEI